MNTEPIADVHFRRLAFVRFSNQLKSLIHDNLPQCRIITSQNILRNDKPDLDKNIGILLLCRPTKNAGTLLMLGR